jgi:hypothetical protein
MDPDFRLVALFLSPALEMPLRTRTAFSRARVRNSSSFRSWGLGVHAMEAQNHAGDSFPTVPGWVPHHCMPEPAPGEGG